MTVDEKFLLAQVASGDDRAFQALFNRYYPQVHAFALRLLKDEDDADDVAQGIFIKLWLQKDRLTDVARINAYLYRMTCNATLNFIAAHHPAASFIPIEQASDLNTPDNAMDDLVAEDMRLLTDLIVSNMPAQRQKVYKLSREQQLSNDDIARQLGIEKKTVENHLTNALREIRKALLYYFLLMLCV